MNNILDNGTVLPSGLLNAHGAEEMLVGFNRSYKNTALKAGIVIASYDATNEYNKTGLCTEYDVQVIEQFEDKGTTSQIYKNCLSTQGFGSIADYFEYTLRPKTFQTNKGTSSFKNQDGAIVLVLCLDGVGEKGVVVGNLIHPDRPTTITSTAPQLGWEYNGVNFAINNDGSFALTFMGATDSKGTPTDSSQGNTVVQVQTDGTFNVNNSEVSMTLDKTNKQITMASSGNWTVNIQGDTNITTSGDTNLNTTGTTTITGQQIQLNGSAGQILTTTLNPVVDYITGLPSIGVPNVSSGQ